MKRVPSHDAAMMVARKNPTVLYGTSGANSNGVKPMEMMIALRLIAMAGSWNMCQMAALQLPCCLTNSRERSRKWTAKSTLKPRVNDERIATGMS